jgi:heme a synthase
MATASSSARDPLVAGWLGLICLMVAAMILVGGATRLTDSGLSITEWDFAKHFMPPLSADGWAHEFALYQRTTEYQLQNRGMTLGEFQFIYLWEWGHRFLGQMLGVVFALPFFAFLATGRLKGRVLPVALLGVMGGVQGAIGWWMVTSGLYGRLDVSSVRLAIHLGWAFLILAVGFWLFLDAVRPRGEAPRGAGRGWVFAFAGLLYVQILMGALVAGSDAGRAYADWPTIGGEIVPSSYAQYTPFWTNFTENLAAVQFHHRTLGYLVLAAVLWLAWRYGGMGRHAAGLVVAQVVLGIATILLGAPLWISLLHQGLAVALWVGTVAWARAVK